jgi:hypothetical protein
MLKLLDTLPHWDRRRPWRSWRNTLVLNLCRDRLRRLASRAGAEEAAAPLCLPSALPSPEEAAQAAEVRDLLHGRTRSAEPREREAFVLHDLEGADAAETRAALGIGESSVRSLLTPRAAAAAHAARAAPLAERAERTHEHRRPQPRTTATGRVARGPARMRGSQGPRARAPPRAGGRGPSDAGLPCAGCATSGSRCPCRRASAAVVESGGARAAAPVRALRWRRIAVAAALLVALGRAAARASAARRASNRGRQTGAPVAQRPASATRSRPSPPPSRGPKPAAPRARRPGRRPSTTHHLELRSGPVRLY